MKITQLRNITMMTMESEAAGTATLNALDDDNHNRDEYHRRAKIMKKKTMTSTRGKYCAVNCF